MMMMMMSHSSCIYWVGHLVKSVQKVSRNKNKAKQTKWWKLKYGLSEQKKQNKLNNYEKNKTSDYETKGITNYIYQEKNQDKTLWRKQGKNKLNLLWRYYKPKQSETKCTDHEEPKWSIINEN